MDSIEQVMQRAKARMLAAPIGSPQAEILYMDEADLATWAMWRNSLPSCGEEAKAAKARLALKNRKGLSDTARLNK